MLLGAQPASPWEPSGVGEEGRQPLSPGMGASVRGLIPETRTFESLVLRCRGGCWILSSCPGCWGR